MAVLFTFVTNLPCTCFLTISVLTTLLNLLELLGIGISFSTSILSISAFKFSKFDFSANLGISAPVEFSNLIYCIARQI